MNHQIEAARIALRWGRTVSGIVASIVETLYDIFAGIVDGVYSCRREILAAAWLPFELIAACAEGIARRREEAYRQQTYGSDRE